MFLSTITWTRVPRERGRRNSEFPDSIRLALRDAVKAPQRAAPLGAVHPPEVAESAPLCLQRERPTKPERTPDIHRLRMWRY
jgi:hypothetical protein